MNRLSILLGALALLLLSSARAGLASDADAYQGLLEKSKRTLAQAIEVGRAACGEGVPFHAELEADKGRIVFSIDVARGAKTCNAVIDAADGTLVEKEVDEEDHSATVAAAKATLVSAIDAALAHLPGKAVEATLALVSGKAVFAVRIVAKGTLEVVQVDGVSGAVLVGAAGPVPAPEVRFTDAFHVASDEWTATGRNPWFVLEPGYVLELEGKDEGQHARLTITVLEEKRTIDGVETRVVEEREVHGGAVAEVSRNFFALSKRTNDVYYFGEEVDVYEGGKVVGHPGSWKSGERGAKFGLMMPGTPLLGARYHQEVAPGVALDRAEIVSLTDTIETPAGTLADCLRTAESTPLEPGKTEGKVYARGIGLVRDGVLRLTKPLPSTVN